MFEIDYWILIAQIFNFLILFFVFKLFISDSMDELIEERKSLLDKLDKADFLYQNKIKEAEDKSKLIIETAHNEARSFTEQNERITANKTQELLDNANREVLYIVDKWKKEVEKERLDMLEEIKDDALDLSLKLNEKLFNKVSFNESFVENQIIEE